MSSARGALITIGEFAARANPPVSEERLTIFVLWLGIPAADYRHTGQPGRPARLFEEAELTALHAALSPWLAVLAATVPDCAADVLAQSTPTAA